MVSKACIVGIYQKKLEEMVRAAPDLSLTVVVPPFWKDERGTVSVEGLPGEGYKLRVEPVVFNGSFHLHFYPRLRRLFRDKRPHVVHIDEEPYNLATYHANRLARQSGAKTLWFSWQNLERRYPPPFSWMERYNLRHTEYAIVGSCTSAEVWRAKGYCGPLAVIPQFGVDQKTFRPPALPRPETPVHLAYVGRLVPEKGVDLLLRAFVEVSGSWRATILGSGPSEGRLRETAVALGLGERVAFRPWLPSDQMPGFYREIDVLVLPSRSRPNWTEQFGRVLVEAMASEVSVVGSCVGEIPHVLGEAGLVFPEGDVAALRKTLAKLVESPVLRRELGALGRHRVLRRFTQRQVAESTLAVYREVMR